MYYLIILILLLLVELFYFRLADKYSIIDKPNKRSSHTRITIRGGGIIFYMGAIIYSLTNRFEYPYFMIALTLVALISFIDDIRPLSQKTRLLFHFAGMVLMFYQIDLFTSPCWYILIGLIICTGIINAYNFMDGINGITGGYSLIVLLSLVYINNRVVCFIESDIIYIMILSTLVFNLFNFRKHAKCFAGDVGSISIAFIILFFIGKLVLITGDLSYIILLVVYGVDSILTIIHRLILHENIGLPHRKHLYQIMSNELKIPHLIVSFIYMLVQGIISTGYFFIHRVGSEYGYIYLLISILILGIIYICLMKKYFYLHT